MSPNPLRIAVVGTGRMGADHVRRLHREIAGARVAAVADPDRTRAAALAAGIDGCTVHTDPPAALAGGGVEAVLVASPGPAHEEVLLEALARGLPVLCEKPLTPDPQSALRVLEAEQKAGRRLIQVGFMRRYDEGFRRLREVLVEASLGRVKLLHCRHRNVRMPAWFTEEMMITDSVVHEIDTTRWLLGQEITAVTVRKPAAGPDGVSDPQLVLLETDSGVLVTVEIFAACGFGYQVRAEAVCERGTASTGDESGVRVSAAGRTGTEVGQDFLRRFGAAYRQELQEWVTAARAGRATGPSAWDGYRAAEVSAAGVAAQRSGQRVPVATAERPAFYDPAAD